LSGKVIGVEILSDMIQCGHNVEPIIGNKEDDDDYGDEEDDEAKEGEEAELIDVETGVNSKKKKVDVIRGPKWKTLEECLIDTWKSVSFFPISGANQNYGKYSRRIYDQFKERKNFGDYATIHMIHNESAMSHRWNIIKKAIVKTLEVAAHAEGTPMVSPRLQ
jgi:hypothetical protein